MRLGLALLLLALVGCERPGAGGADMAPQVVARAADMAAEAAPDQGRAEDAADAGDALPAGTPEQVMLLTRAKRYVLEEDLESAEPLFEALAAQERFTEPVLAGTLALAELRVEQGKPEDALKLYDALLAREDIKPYGAPHLLVGRLYVDHARHDQAIAALKAAMDKEPDWFFIWGELGALYEAIGEASSADEAWARYGEAHTKAVGRLRLKIAGPAERVRIVDALGWVDDEESVAPLIEALKDEEALVRERAALALGELGATGGERAREALKAVLVHDTQEPVRQAARDALKRIPRADAPAP